MATDGSIEPDTFDVIVLGTGLPEAILAAAAAAARLSVLHLDPHDFYGAHWTSLDFKQFASWAASGGSFSVPSASVKGGSAPVEDVVQDLTGSGGDLSEASFRDQSRASTIDSGSADGVDHPVAESVGDDSSAAEELYGKPGEAASLPDRFQSEEMELGPGNGLFSGLEVFEYEGESLGPLRAYSIDLCGPRLIFCGSNLVDILLGCGASHYVEFKGLDASYIWTEAGMSAVPSSRADVFKDKSLSLPDKRVLMRFFKLVTDYTTSEDQHSAAVSAEDLDAPFLNFLQRQRLPASIQSIILYAIALVDEDQQRNVEDSRALLTTRDGLQKLALYLSSVARLELLYRFPNASGAFLYPLYGQGELPQAFCRSAAVNGALYVLRRPVKSLLIDKDSKEYKGVRTLQGQVLYSKRLIMGPSVLPQHGAGTNHSFAGLDDQSKESTRPTSSTIAAKASPGERAGSQVARCVCITDRSLSEGQGTLLVIFPPGSVSDMGSFAIRALQLSCASSVCPEDRYIVQLSAICTDRTDGRRALEAAVRALFGSPLSRDEENIEVASVLDGPKKPKILWSIFYIQAVQTDVKDLNIPGVAFCRMPDGTLDGENMLIETEKLFKELFPDEDFFPKTVKSQDTEEDDGLEET